MLKLLKFELLGNYRSYFHTYLFYLLFCIIAPFASNALQNIFIPVLGISSVAIMISVFINIIVNFCKSMFTKEGYLSHTLPYKGSVLLASKFLSAILWLCITILVLIGGILILSLLVTLRSGISVKELYSGLEMANAFIRYEMALEGFHEIFTLKRMISSGLILSLVSLIYCYMLIFMIAILVNTPIIRSYKTPIGIVLFFLITMIFDRIGIPAIENIRLLEDVMYNAALIHGIQSFIQCLICYLVSVFVMNRYLEIN